MRQDLYRDNATGFCHKHRADYLQARSRPRVLRPQPRSPCASTPRQWREEHPEEHRAAVSAWNAANRTARFASDARRKLAAGAGMDDIDRMLSACYRLAIRNDPRFYCGSPETAHVDHYFPLAKGGTDSWENLVRSCDRCNNAKYTQCGTAFLLRSAGS